LNEHSIGGNILLLSGSSPNGGKINIDAGFGDANNGGSISFRSIWWILEGGHATFEAGNGRDKGGEILKVVLMSNQGNLELYVSKEGLQLLRTEAAFSLRAVLLR